MAATPSVRILKTFPYRGGTKQYSNRYHFNGGTPADAAHWYTLMDAIVLAEKVTLTTETTIIELIGYAAGSDVPVASKAYATAGTGAFSAGHTAPGAVAGLVRYSTAARTSKNHPIYLFNYYHGVRTDATLADNLLAAQKTTFGTYASAWISPGFSDGSITVVRAGPNGTTATGQLVENFLTHRDFPN